MVRMAAIGVALGASLALVGSASGNVEVIGGAAGAFDGPAQGPQLMSRERELRKKNQAGRAQAEAADVAAVPEVWTLDTCTSFIMDFSQKWRPPVRDSPLLNVYLDCDAMYKEAVSAGAEAEAEEWALRNTTYPFVYMGEVTSCRNTCVSFLNEYQAYLKDRTALINNLATPEYRKARAGARDGAATRSEQEFLDEIVTLREGVIHRMRCFSVIEEATGCDMIPMETERGPL